MWPSRLARKAEVMDHGIAGYFLECKRFQRRASLLTLALSVALLAFLWVGTTPPLRKAMIDTSRFGFEGPEQYVRRVTLDQARGHTATLADIGQIQPQTKSRRGGSARKARGEAGVPEPKQREGPGQDDDDLAMRSVSRTAGVPVFQSTELVIDRLVRPEYPPALLDKNIEGKVMVQALIDTVGNVIEVQVMASTGESQFETAAEEAVRQCRFRPYRPAGEASEIYAVFRFVFRIY